jgi:hypothetical protein
MEAEIKRINPTFLFFEQCNSCQIESFMSDEEIRDYLATCITRSNTPFRLSTQAVPHDYFEPTWENLTRFDPNCTFIFQPFDSGEFRAEAV